MKIDLKKGGMPQMQRGSSVPAGRTTYQASEERPDRPIGSQRTSEIGLKAINWIITGAIYLLTFLTPLFFLPNVPSILELNKQFLIVVIGGIAFLAWIGKLAWEGRIRIRKNFLLIPVVLILIIFSLGTIFSVYREQSMWGSFGTEGLSLVSVIAYIAIFLVVTNNFYSRKKISNLILLLIASSFFASFYALFQIFGKFIFKNPAIAQNSFNTIGSVYSLSVFMGAILILAVGTLLEKKSVAIKVALIVISLILIFLLIMINFRTTLIVFLVGMAILMGLSTITTGSQEKNRALLFPMIVLTLVLLATLIGKNGSIVRIQLPVEVGLSQGASYDIAKGTLKNSFLLGSGLSNYDSSYLKNKPAEINQTNFWSVKFSEASSRFFTLITSTGFLGIIAFLFLVGSVLVYIFSSFVKIFGKNEEGTFVLIGVTSAWIYLSLIYFFYPSNISTDFLWWMLTAVFVVSSSLIFQKKEELISETSSPRVSLILSFIFVLIIVGFISLIFLEGQKYVAAAAYNKALSSDAQGAKIEELVEKINRVVSLDPSRDLYHRNLSVALFALLNDKISQKGTSSLSEDDRAQISSIYFTAEEQARAAVTLNPQSSDNLIQLAQINQNVVGSKDGAEDEAIKNYREALKYDPQNPSIYYQIGQIYLMMADIENAKSASQQQGQNKQPQLSDKAKENLALAKQNFLDAVRVKTNYIPAQFMVAVTLDRLGEIDQAIAQLEESRKMSPRDAGILFQLGALYYKDEQLDSARMQFEEAVKLADNYSNARYFLGLIYDKQNNRARALEQFKKVSELNPDNQDIKKIVTNLENGKKALDGLEENAVNQGAGEQTEQGQPSLQRDQQPVPPETPIGPEAPPEDQNP